MNYQQMFQMLLMQGATPQQAFQMLGPPPSGQQQNTPGVTPGNNGPVGDALAQLFSLFGTQQAGSAAKAPYNLQMQAANESMNPATMNARIGAFTKPLSNQLVGSIMRSTAPNIAARGLATSPGMSQQIDAEALAPYEMQEQQLGSRNAFESLQPSFQVGSELAGSYPETNAALYKLLAQFAQGGASGNSGSNSSPFAGWFGNAFSSGAGP